MHPIRNFCMVETAQGYSSIDTVIKLIANDGLKLPDPAKEGRFNLVWFNFTDYKNPSDDPYREIVQVTAKAQDTLTVLRGQEDIAASAKNLTGKTYKFILTLTKAAYDAIVPGYHGIISSVDDGNPEPDQLGDNAVDFQFSRTDGSQGAKGTCSFACGADNKASGAYSFVANMGNTASGQSSSAAGSGNTASGENAFCNGSENTAAALNSMATGYGSKARLRGQYTRANASNGTAGDAQYSNLILKATTTDDQPKALLLNVSGGEGSLIILENNTSYLFKGLILGRQGSTMSVGYEIKGLITRSENAASTAIQGNAIVERIYDQSLGCDVLISADTINGALSITVQGEADKTIRWICSLDWIEIKD